jgi:multicomponent K+:H+ antiporter subunit G
VSAALSPAVAGLVALLVLLGAALALIGSFGLLRLPSFYERVHPPTMGTTLGVGFTVAASILGFSAIESGPVLQAILIAVFAIVTTPVTYMLLVRASVGRDRSSRGERADTPGARGTQARAD